MKQWVQDFQKKGRKREGGFESPLDHEITVRDTDSRGILCNSYGWVAGVITERRSLSQNAGSQQEAGSSFMLEWRTGVHMSIVL